MKKKYPNLAVVAVNLDKEKEKAEEFLKKHPAQFEIVYDPEANLAKEYKVKGMPYSLIFDSSGNVKYKHIGFTEAQAEGYESEIKGLIEK